MARRGVWAGWAEPACNSAEGRRSKLAQGKPGAGPGLWRRWLAARLVPVLTVWVLLMLGLVAPATAAPACQPLPLQRLAPGLWWVPAPAAEADAGNRGHAHAVLLARDGPRLWAVGSGATPVLGQRLRCTAQARLGQAVTDLLTPWAHAEAALGAAGLGAPRHWAHAAVAAAMAEQCVHCVERLRQRLGAAADDLGDDSIRLPQQLLQGAQGRVGPFDWWVLPRARGRVVTVLRHRASGVAAAPGLLWGDGPPDTREADVALLQAALQRLPQLAPTAQRWVGGSGPVLDTAALRHQALYVQALRQAVQQAVVEGGAETSPAELPAPGAQAGVAMLFKAWADHPRHALNWQRAWRQAEDDWLRGAPR